MDILSIIIMALIALFAVIGIIAGLVKGFTRTKTWAVELVLTGLIAIGVSGLLKEVNSLAAAIITLAVTIGLICLFMFLFKLFRVLLGRRIEKRKKLSYYKQYDEREDNVEQILCAIGTEDKKKYKKLVKKKFKQSGGVWSVIDKIVGAVVLAIKGIVIAGFMASLVLVVLDFTRLPADGGSLYGFFGGIYESVVWQSLSSYIFDFLVVAIIMLCIKSGYSSGISSTIWSLFVLGLVVGSGILSFRLAFNNAEFVSAAEKLETSLSESLSGAMDMLSMVGLTALTIAKIIIGLITFILLIVAVILIAVFVPKLIDRARESVVYRSIDGVLGAIILTVFIFAVLMVVGAVANSIYNAPFMGVFNKYFEKSGIATYFYDNNLLNLMNVLTGLPMESWFS